MARAQVRVLIDHDEIRRWAEERGARPARVKGTGGRNDPGLLRLDFPGFTGEDTLETISWDEWFRGFDENNLALIVEDRTATGQRSNFNKLVRRDAVVATQARGRSQGARKRTASGGKAARATGSRRARPRARQAKRASGRTAAKTAGGRSSTSRKTAAAGRGRAKTSTARTAAKRKRAAASGKSAKRKRASAGSSSGTRPAKKTAARAR